MILAAKIVALLVHVIGGFPYLALGLIVPPPALWVMWAIWVGLLVIMIVKWSHWRIVVGAPVVAIVLFFAVPAAGEALFGWTA